MSIIDLIAAIGPLPPHRNHPHSRCSDAGIWPDDWFAGNACHETAVVKRICRQCGLRSECRSWAVGRHIDGVPLDGIWAGTTREERTTLASQITTGRGAA